MCTAQLNLFRQTQLYNDIKTKCGLPLTAQKPNEEWCITRGLLKREHGLASGACNGRFSRGQQRSITNLYPPNSMQRQLLQRCEQAPRCDKVNVCRYDRSGTNLMIAFLHPTTTATEGVQLLNAMNGTYRMVQCIEPDYVKWGITDVDISPSGQLIAYATFSKSIYIKPIDGPCIWERIALPIKRSHQLVLPLRFWPCGRKLVGSYRNVSFFLADIETHAVEEVPLVYNFMENQVYAMSLLSEMQPNVIACGHSSHGSVDIFDLRLPTKWVSTFLCHYEGVTHIDSRNDGYYFLTNSKDNSAKIWDLRRPTFGEEFRMNRDSCLMVYKGHRVITFPQSAKFSPMESTGQRYIYAGCATGSVLIYDVLTGAIRECIEGHQHVVNVLDWHPIRTEIISASWDGSVHLNAFDRLAVKQRRPRLFVDEPEVGMDLQCSKINEKDKSFWSNLTSIG